MNFLFIYITVPDKKGAKKIAECLLEKRLIACANIFPINSMYRWEGEIVDENEFVLIVKTTEDNFESVRAEVERIHPYDIPCITRIPVSSNEGFFNWLRGEVKES